MNIRDIDLNLLVIFQSLMNTQSVSETAKSVGLSQPAVSHALARLRRDLGDDLLVRSSRSLVPTPYAVELNPQVTDILGRLESALIRKSFDPVKAKGQVRIQSTEYFEQLVLPLVLEFLRETAPGIQVVSLSTQGQLPKDELLSGTSEIAIAGFFGQLPDGIYQQKIFADRMVCLAAQSHPTPNKKKISMTEFLKLKHVFISPEGNLSGGLVDRLLAKQKKKREIVASIAGFAAPAWICTSDNYACTLPQKLAEKYAEILPLKWFELPVEAPPIQVVQVWHERTQRNPLLRFIRASIHEICTGL
jgi:DNA-binding transcriptional LysR family regulator